MRKMAELYPTLQKVPETLDGVQKLLSNVDAHYSHDNITIRDTWMSDVNRRLAEAETAREENRQCIRSLETKLDKNNEDTLSLLIDSKRNTIINFADLVIDENKPVTREQFHRIFKLYKEYEDIIKKNNMTNGEVDIAIRIIKESYEKHMRHHSYYNKFGSGARQPAGLHSISCLSYNKRSNWLATHSLVLPCP